MTEAFGPDLPQKREVVTAIPGPKSQELAQRRKSAVSAALGAAVRPMRPDVSRERPIVVI